MKSRFTFLLKVKDPAACPGLVEFFFDELQNVNYEVSAFDEFSLIQAFLVVQVVFHKSLYNFYRSSFVSSTLVCLW